MQSASPMHAFVSEQQLVSRQVSHVASPLVSPHDPAGGLPGGGPDGTLHAVPQVLFAHDESALSFVAPEGCDVSHVAMQAEVVQLRAQSRSAMQSLSPRHAFASPQQFVSRHESHFVSPLAKPQVLVLGGGFEGPPPQAVVQLVSMQVKSVSRMAVPVGCAVRQLLMHVSSVHALPHVMSAVQSASFTHAAFWVQQLVSRHESHVASPVWSPHVPPAPPNGVMPEPFAPPLFFPSAAIAAAFPGFESESFECHPSAFGSSVFASGLGPEVVVVVSVTVHAMVNVDVMAITPQVIAFMCPPRGRRSSRPRRGEAPPAAAKARRRRSLSVRT